MSQDHIRNFAVISHIDHGKTTLTDRLLEITHTITDRQKKDRLLDSNPIERERGITIKLAPARMGYRLPKNLQSICNFKFAILNLIDTPGHVDFSYEVSRSLNACEGALVLVDAAQGIQAQTMANAYLALEQNLTLIPVINKIDLPNAEPQAVAQDLIDTFGFKQDEIIHISAKTGQNIDQVLQAIVTRIPPPQGALSGAPRALVFNSHFSSHLGVIATIKVIDGKFKANDNLLLLGTKAQFQAKQVGVFKPFLTSVEKLSAGETGFIATGLKDSSLVTVGDTITTDFKAQPLPGYQQPNPVVFIELYPLDGKDFVRLNDALGKLKLNDAALTFETTSSAALGHGLRIGFLGLLHAEIVQERLEREFNLELIATTPTVKHLVTLTSGQTLEIHSASDLPDPNQIQLIKEPFIDLTIYTDKQYLNKIIPLCLSHRALLINQEYFGNRVKFDYLMPLTELIAGFYDRLKSVSQGFASLDYKHADFKPVNAIKLDILVNKEIIKPLSSIVIKDKAQTTGRRIVEKLKQVLPQQQFEVPIQAAVGGKILARATLKSWRKDVTAKLYGGDQTRKDKLLKKQKKGKKRLKSFGKVQISQEAFLAVLEK